MRHSFLLNLKCTSFRLWILGIHSVLRKRLYNPKYVGQGKNINYLVSTYILSTMVFSQHTYKYRTSVFKPEAACIRKVIRAQNTRSDILLNKQKSLNMGFRDRVHISSIMCFYPDENVYKVPPCKCNLDSKPKYVCMSVSKYKTAKFFRQVLHFMIIFGKRCSGKC